MNEPERSPGSSSPDEAVPGEYQDPHYPDEEEDIVIDDIDPFRKQVAVPKKPSRLPPRPRHYMDD